MVPPCKAPVQVTARLLTSMWWRQGHFQHQKDLSCCPFTVTPTSFSLLFLLKLETKQNKQTNKKTPKCSSTDEQGNKLVHFKEMWPRAITKGTSGIWDAWRKLKVTSKGFCSSPVPSAMGTAVVRGQTSRYGIVSQYLWWPVPCNLPTFWPILLCPSWPSIKIR